MNEKVPAVMAMKSGAKALAIVPQTFEECYRMAKLLAVSDMVPDSYKDKPDACCVALMQGLEVGLSPMAALQSIAVINGRPCIWGDGALAVVRASGQLAFIREFDDGAKATCIIKRKGEAETIIRTFSQQDAEKALLARKSGPWQTYPQRMRQMRARSWALRDGFADLLKGLHVAEEAQDIPMRDVTPAPLEVPDIPDGQSDAVDADFSDLDINQDQANEVSAAAGPANNGAAMPDPIASPAAYRKHLDEEMSCCADRESLDDVWSGYESVTGRMGRPDRLLVEADYERHVQRIGGAGRLL